MPEMRTPAAWLLRLERKLDHRWFTQMGVDDAYYEGDHKLAFATAQFREAFGSLFSAIADNWMPIVVDTAAERLRVLGYRFGNSDSADEAAWEIWQANGLDASSSMLHTEAIKLGEAYWMVEPPAGGSDAPGISAEDPSQVIVETSAANRRHVLAGLKKWVDEEDGHAYANVYLPEWIAKFRSAGKLSKGGRTGGRINWTENPYDPGGPNPLGVVPIVPMPNDPSLRRGGRSDIRPVRPVQNAINKLLSDMMIGAEYQAFPQRVLLGVEVPKDPETGQPVRAAQLQASRSRTWVFNNKDAKVEQFDAASLDGYVKAREHLIHGFTAKTRIPAYYVSGEIVNASGDAMQIADNNLVRKVERKHDPFGEGHEDAMRLAFLAMGDKQRARVAGAEVIWKDPATVSFASLVDGLVKLKELGLPDVILWEKAGFTPQEIARAKRLAEAAPAPLEDAPASVAA